MFLWIKNTRRAKETPQPLLDAEGSIVTNDGKMADVHNVLFASVEPGALGVPSPWS